MPSIQIYMSAVIAVFTLSGDRWMVILHRCGGQSPASADNLPDFSSCYAQRSRRRFEASASCAVLTHLARRPAASPRGMVKIPLRGPVRPASQVACAKPCVAAETRSKKRPSGDQIERRHSADGSCGRLPKSRHARNRSPNHVDVCERPRAFPASRVRSNPHLKAYVAPIRSD